MGKRLEKISTKLKIGMNAPKSILNNILKVPMSPPCAFLIMTSLPHDVIMGKFCYNSACRRDMSQILAPNRGFSRSAN